MRRIRKQLISSLLFTAAFAIFIFSCKKNTSETRQREFQEQTPEALCIADEMLQQSIAADPSVATRLQQLEDQTIAYEKRGRTFRVAGKLYLPVVIHIVLPDPSIITDAQIQSQIEVWNKDFNKQNIELQNRSVYLAGYSLASVANCQIQFYVTNVIRKVTAIEEFPPQSFNMKFDSTGGSNAVEPSAKLNVWICNNPSGLSWGYFPNSTTPEKDGIVIDYFFFGTNASSQIGRVGTHEVGHWLNLRHIWGDRACGDDLVKDTPAHDSATYYCPPTGLRSSCKGKPLKQWMNYMDYSYGRCKYMFSAGQKTRMDAAIDGPRKPYFATTKKYVDLFP